MNGMQPEKTVSMTVMIILCSSVTSAAVSDSQPSSNEACPRGLFLLERGSSDPLPLPMSSPSMSSSSNRVCVKVCPLGFYHSIKFKNKPTFSDINSGSGTQHASLRCIPCKSECTVCLGPRPSSCFVCDQEWVQKHKSSFAHETPVERQNDLNATTHDCQVVVDINSRQHKRQFSQVKGRSIGTVALLVALSAMFSAVLVFSVYRLHWERRRRGNGVASTNASPFQWLTRCWERKKYSAIRAQPTNSDRATWSNAEEESVIFSSEDLDIRGSH